MKLFGLKRKSQPKRKTPTHSKKTIVTHSNEEESVGVIVYRATGRMKRKYGI